MNTTRLRKSRNHWKAKAINRQRTVTVLAKRLERKNLKLLTLEERNASMEATILELRSQISSLEKPLARQETRILCVSLFILGAVPCNAVVRVLRHLKTLGVAGLNWIPDPSSVVNWIARTGLGMLKLVGQTSSP